MAVGWSPVPPRQGAPREFTARRARAGGLDNGDPRLRVTHDVELAGDGGSTLPSAVCGV